ncbi:MAG: alpha/beta hydrolase [Ignavibacteria bacterium]|nr:alpha/beta hydrolase [Ignavibacteria bacterium]
MKKHFLILLFLSTQIFCQQRDVIKLWTGIPLYLTDTVNNEKSELGSDNILRISNVSYPTLEFWKPEKPNGTSIIICPGGGYVRLAITSEGDYVAKWFAERGVSAFILKYRLPDNSTMNRKEIVPLSDAQQAINYLRSNSEKLKINPNRIGIMGFSAGGHLAATASVHFSDSFIRERDQSLRPDFSVLIYPVITMQNDFTHQGSKKALIGENANDSLVNYFSNELNVTGKTPPTFIMHATDDKAVPVENSLKYYDALRRSNVNASLHIFQCGGHGFTMKNKFLDEQWFYLLEKWLTENKFMH